MQRASEFSGEQNLNGIQPERPSSSQCTPPLSQPHGVVSEARFSHGRSDGQPSSEGWLGSPRLIVGMESAAQIKNKLCMTWLSEATGERAKQRQGPWPNPKGLESEREGGSGAKHEGGRRRKTPSLEARRGTTPPLSLLSQLRSAKGLGSRRSGGAEAEAELSGRRRENFVPPTHPACELSKSDEPEFRRCIDLGVSRLERIRELGS